KESFEIAPSGTHHKVFISDRYVIRFRDDNPELLSREADFLRHLDHPLIPKVLWVGKIDGLIVMVEERLTGKTVDAIWKVLTEDNQTIILEQIIQFLRYLQTQTADKIYSINTGKKYLNFFYCLTDKVEWYSSEIKKTKQAEALLNNLLLIIDKPEAKTLFPDKGRISLVHGDLIIHNLLTDNNNLTGILDWELALFGDSDYDLFRLFYYQECAKAYQEQGIDKTFESDFMDKLMAMILESDLIKNKNTFWVKYEFTRAIFYINALHWAVCSDNPIVNISELTAQWDKKNGVECLRT
ncbi:MAG: aminoglycoside phosphotransferase family protein, partial [Candidatus Parcubacteria bacterium]|nr:aminoglycoside phosphotransferase family protein [Candidatus Parcubacteria bacterium]